MAYTPKLVTRQETTTTRTTETLNKNQKLSFQEMDENFLQLQKGSISVVGDDSTGTEFKHGDTLKVAGTGGIATSVSGDTVTIDASSIVTSSLGDLTAVGSTLISPSNADITLSPAGTGNINADSNKIINVADPTAGQDAATKSYVDTQVSAVGGGGDLGNLQVNNTTLTPINTNDNLILTANGTGDILIQTDSGTLAYIGESTSANVFTFLPTSGILRYSNEMILDTANGAQIYLKNAANDGDINFINLAGGFNRFGSGSNPAYITSNGAYDLNIGVNDWDNTRPRINLDYDGDLSIIGGDGQNVRIEAQLIVDGNVKFNDNSITTTASNSNLQLAANGTGTVTINGLSFPTADGTNGQVLKTNGTGTLSFGDVIYTETDPVVGAINGIVKANGAGTISAAVAGTDYLTNSPITVVGDDSTGTVFNTGETIKIAGAQNITTAVSGDILTITGPNLSSYITASSSDTLTNKTIDANGTGNSISNLEVADFAAATIVTQAEGISANNNDTTIPTSAAVKAYADSVGGGGGGSTGDLVIVGSTISTPSNANLVLDAGGTGLLELAFTDGAGDHTIQGQPNIDIRINPNNNARVAIDDLEGVMNHISSDYNPGRGIYAGVRTSQSTLGDKRRYFYDFRAQHTLDSGIGPSSSSNNRWRGVVSQLDLELNGNDITSTSSYAGRGATGIHAEVTVRNDDSASTADTTHHALFNGYINYRPTLGTINVTEQSAGVVIAADYRDLTGSGGGNMTVANHYDFYGGKIFAASGSPTVTNYVGLKIDNNVYASNKYGIQMPDTFLNHIGTIEKYREDIGTLTSATSITVDCSTAPVHTVTLDHNATFTISNLGTGQTVTLIITQGTTGGTGAFTSVLFAGGDGTLSTGSGTIDVLTIFNDGTNLLGSLAKAFS